MILYKYFKKERTEPIREFALRVTQPNLFNDPWECLPSMAMPKSWRLPPQQSNPDDINNLAAGKALQDEWSKRIGILCLSESPASTLMWGHYASNHEGYVLGFDSTHEFFRGSSGLDALTKVIYTDQRFQLGSNGIAADVNDVNYLFQKGRDWRYEAEWRRIFPLESATSSSADVYVYQFPPEALSEVIIGYRTSDKLGSDLVALQSSLPWVKIRYARPSATNYQMILEATKPAATISFPL